jgi:hypothetical protein
MRKFNVLAAISAGLLMAGPAPAKEKPDQPKPRKICRTEQMSGRITPQRICRVLPPSDSPAADAQRKPADPPQADNGRD